MKLSITLYSFLFTFSFSAFANENFSVSRSTTTVVLGTQKSQSPYLELNENQYSKVIVEENVTGYIPFNRNVGYLNFKVFSPIKTKMYLKWDNEDSLYVRHSKEIKFRRSGDYQSITFNVIRPVSGNIYLMTSNNKLIQKIRYTVKKQRKYSQSIRMNIRENESGINDTQYQSTSINYSISQRSNIGNGRWSGNVNFSDNNSDSKSISASVGYSW